MSYHNSTIRKALNKSMKPDRMPGHNPTGKGAKLHVPGHGMMGANYPAKGAKKSRNRIIQAMRKK